MVVPANCSSPATPQCSLAVESTKAEKCTKCAGILLTIQNLEIELAEEKEQKENLADCLNKTFASLTKEFDSHELKDARIHELTAQLEKAAAKLKTLSNKESTANLKKTTDEFQEDIMADKKTLRQELEKHNGAERGDTRKEAFTHHLDNDLSNRLEATSADNLTLNADLETANSTILHLETGLQEAKKATDAQQPPMKNGNQKEENSTKDHGELQARFKELSSQLHVAQRAHTLIKKARGNANRILDHKFQDVNQQLQFFTHQSGQLVQELEHVRSQLLRAEQEIACLRNHLEYTQREKEHLGILLADANRRAVDCREVDRLQNVLVEQRDWCGKLREENVRLEDAIEAKNDEIQRLLERVDRYTNKNEKLAGKNRQLQKLIEELHGGQGAWEDKNSFLDDFTSEPATPATPATPRTPTSPQSPADEAPPMIQRKRRSDEHEGGNHKKQKQ